MLGNKRLSAVVFALVLLALPCRAKDKQSDWIKVSSEHFSVISDAGDRRARDVALRFEQMRFVFGTLFSVQTVSMPVPLEIIAFRNTSELRNFVPLWKGKPVQADGLYQGGEDRNFILLDLSVEDPYQVVFHEYAHLLLNGNYPPTPVWFDEGFAQYFSTVKVGKTGMQIGLPPEGAAETLRGNALFRTVDLFGVRHDSPVYNEDGDHRSLFYQQSWLYVHYLLDTKKLEQAGAYFDLTQNQHVPIAQAVQQAFGMDAPHFDQVLQDYFKGNRMLTYNVELPSMETMVYVSERLHSLDSQAILADAHLHSPGYTEKAVSEFQQILSADPDNAAAHRGLGYVYLLQNDFRKAAQHLERAAALDSKNPRVHYYSAYLMHREAAASGAEANWPGIQAQLHEAIVLDPQFPDAYDLLAYVQMEQGAADAALENSKTAVRLSPRNQQFQANFGQYLIAAGKLDEAEAVFQRLKESDDAKISATASKNLQLIEQYKVHGVPTHMVNVRPSFPEKEWGKSSAVSARTSLTAADLSSDNPAETKAGNSEAPTPAATTAAREPPPAKPDKRPIRFLKGTLVSVDCKQDSSAALLRVAVRGASGQKVWNMTTPDRDKLVLVGADTFSCDWSNQRVAVNYRAASENRGDLVSLEIQ